MADKENIIAHLQIINSWARHDGEYNAHRCSTENGDVARWTLDAIAYIMHQEETIWK